MKTGQMDKYMMNKNSKGFTLIELMVAISLLAVLSVLVFSSINSSFKSFEALSNNGRIQSGLAGVISIMSDDFINMTPRAVRTSSNINSNSREGAFVYNNDDSDYLLQFTRSGNSIIAEDNSKLRQMGVDNPQSGFSRVAYKFADSRLYRYEWGVLDRDKENVDDFARESILLEDVYDTQIIVYSESKDGSLNEEDKWPPTSLSGSSVKKEFIILPAGISIRVILNDSREYLLFFPGAAGITI